MSFTKALLSVMILKSMLKYSLWFKTKTGILAYRAKVDQARVGLLLPERNFSIHLKSP